MSTLRRQDESATCLILGFIFVLKGQLMNNTEREQWIDNDEGLYDWWKSSRLSKRQFIRQNRAQIDEIIRKVTEGIKPAHYLKYGG